MTLFGSFSIIQLFCRTSLITSFVLASRCNKTSGYVKPILRRAASFSAVDTISFYESTLVVRSKESEAISHAGALAPGSDTPAFLVRTSIFPGALRTSSSTLPWKLCERQLIQDPSSSRPPPTALSEYLDKSELL